MIPNSTHLSPLHVFLLIVALAVGSAYALYCAYKVFIPYADCVNGALIYFDIRGDGLAPIRYWALPPDNFLLTLIPIYVVWFYIFGSSVTSLVTFAYAVFLLGIVLSALIIAKVASSSRQAACSVILLFAAPTNLINANQSHPLGHNSTMVYVLLAGMIVIQLLASQRRNVWGIGILVFITAICAFSDPWFDAAFTIPALVSLAILAFWPSARASGVKRTAWLIAGSLVVGLACGRGIYEILAHYELVPRRSTPIGFADAFGANLRLLFEVLPLLFNYSGGKPQTPFDWAFIGLGLGVAGIACRQVVPVWRSVGIAGRFMLLFALLSSSSMALAFLVTRYTSFNSGPAAARYVLNVYYMAFVAGIIIIGGAWARLGWKRFIIVAWVGLFSLPELRAEWRNFEYSGLENESLRVHRELIAHLQKEGLSAGFAPYSSGAIGANSLTYIGENEFVVRPVDVADGRIRPFHLNVNRQWYAPGKSANFLVVHRSDEGVYYPAALASFGAPARTIRLAEYVAWVWTDNLMPPK